MGGGPNYEAFMAGMGPHIERKQKLEDEYRTLRKEAILKHLDNNPDMTENEIAQAFDELAAMYDSKQIRNMIKESGKRLAEYRKTLSQQPIQPPKSTSPLVPEEPAPQPAPDSQIPRPGPVPIMTPPPSMSAAQTVSESLPGQKVMPGTIWQNQTNAPEIPSTSPMSAATPTPAQPSVSPPPSMYPESDSILPGMIASGSKSLAERVDEVRAAFPDATDAEIMNIVTGRTVSSTASQKPQVLKSYLGADKKIHSMLLFPGETEPREVISTSEAQGSYRRPVAFRDISLQDAISARDSWGAKFVDQTGNPLPLDQMDKNLKLTPVQVGDGELYYVVGSQKQVVQQVGGEYYAATEYNKDDPNTWVDLGAGQVTRLSGTEMPVMVGGKLRMVPKYSESVPQIVGAKTSGLAANVTPPPSMAERTVEGATPVAEVGGAVLTPPPATPPAASVTTPPAKPKSAPSTLAGTSGRDIEGLQPPQHRMWVQIAVPVREASSQLFGNPDHPEYKGLDAYAHLADDPKASAAIANAINVSLNHLDTLDKSHGGLINLLSYKSGVPQSLSREYVESMRSVASDPLKGHPEWQRAYDSTMAVYAVIMGMRAATRAPASEFTAKSLEREVPIAGLYVGDSRQYYNKLSQIAMEIDNVTKQIPDEAMNRKEKDFISTKVDEMLTKARQEPKPNLDDNPYRKRSK